MDHVSRRISYKAAAAGTAVSAGIGLMIDKLVPLTGWFSDHYATPVLAGIALVATAVCQEQAWRDQHPFDAYPRIIGAAALVGGVADGIAFYRTGTHVVGPLVDAAGGAALGGVIGGAMGYLAAEHVYNVPQPYRPPQEPYDLRPPGE